jgi:hypothetical protein
VFVVVLSTSGVLCKRHRYREQAVKEVPDEEPKELSVIPETNSFYTVKHTVGETTRVRNFNLYLVIF